MTRAYVQVEVDIWEVIAEADDDELIEEIEDRGFHVTKKPIETVELDYEDLNYLLKTISDVEWEGRRVYEKLRKMRYGQ